jgi:hypothetical protein
MRAKHSTDMNRFTFAQEAPPWALQKTRLLAEQFSTNSFFYLVSMRGRSYGGQQRSDRSAKAQIACFAE